jgi:hypothetical protein
MILYVGDVNTDNTQLPNNPVLITQDNLHGKLPDYAFTTLGDIGSVENLYYIMGKAHDIIFSPPKVWSDGKTIDSRYSAAWITKHYIDIINKKITNNNPVIDTRKSEKKHLFVAGCSTANGSSLTDKRQRYAQLLSDYYNLPLVSLTKGGTSIEWASDQILRSNITSGDLVVWGLTNNARYMSFVEQQVIHWTSKNATGEFSKVLVDDNLLEKNILRIERVVNFCEGVGAKLIIFSCHCDIDVSSRISYLDNFLFLHGTNGTDWDSSFLDFGSDGVHPGPLTHKFYADKIILHLLGK